jgi:hypothetical protein
LKSEGYVSRVEVVLAHNAEPVTARKTDFAESRVHSAPTPVLCHIQGLLAGWTVKREATCRLPHKVLQGYSANLKAHFIQSLFHVAHIGRLAKNGHRLLEKPLGHVTFGHEKYLHFPC